MGNVSERLGYIHGLMDGLKLNKDDDMIKLMSMIVDTLDDINASVEALEADQQELNDYVESIDDDLSDLEVKHGMVDDDFEAFDDDEIDFTPASERRSRFSVLKNDAEDEEDEDEEDFDEEAETELYIGCVCPECGKFFSVKNPDTYEDDQKFICPFCKKHVLITPMNPEEVPTAEPVK